MCIRAECCRGKAPGEPYEGKLHVRFDEGVLETELWNGLRHRRSGESRRYNRDSPFLWPPRQRPTLQKRNVLGHLPEEHRAGVEQQLDNAYGMAEYADAKRALERLHRELMELNPSAARSLAEGLEETLTVHKLRVPELLRKSLSSTNAIESAFSVVEELCRRVKRWRGGDHLERWVGSGLLLAESKFHRLRGYRQIPQLVEAMVAHLSGKGIAGRNKAA